MKTLKYILLVAVIIFGGQELAAQNKKMDKKTKKKLRSYLKNPSAYEDAVNANKEKLDSALFQLTELETRNDELRELNRNYYDSISDLNKTIAEYKETAKSIGGISGKVLPLEYRVQLAAFSKNDFGGSIEKLTAIRTENVAGVTKYYIGSFQDPFEAEKFASYIRSLCVGGAFVTKFVEGVRVDFDMKTMIK